MYQLLKGKAGSRDVEETIHTLQLRPHCADFIERIWPE